MCFLMLFYFDLIFFFFYSGSFRWTAEKDTLLLREILYVEPYKFKHGTKESGLPEAWSEEANGLNQHEGFKVMPRDQRSVRDRFNKLLSEFKAKMRKEEGESGTNPEPLSEAETMLEDIQEQTVSARIDLTSATVKEGEQQKNERRKAMDVRDAAMNTWAKSKCVVDSDGEECAKEKPRKRSRKGGSDALKFLEAKCQADAEVTKEEVALRQQEPALQQKLQEKFILKPKCFFSSSNKQFINNSSLIFSSNNFNRLKI